MLDVVRTARRGHDLLCRALVIPDHTPAVTAIEPHGGILVKRDDTWSRGGASGAKARAMFTVAENATGIVTAGSRISPQLERAALVAHALGIPAQLHTGFGRPTDETLLPEATGAVVVRHRPARLSVIRARYRTAANELGPCGWAAIPFGMEHHIYAEQVAEQAAHLPADQAARIVVPVGSGMTLAAICRGLDAAGHRVPVLGVCVGADPTRLLDRHAPNWRDRVDLADSTTAYEQPAENRLGDLVLDPHYEAKCLPYLRDGDLLWTVGLRTSALSPTGAPSCRPR